MPQILLYGKKKKVPVARAIGITPNAFGQTEAALTASKIGHDKRLTLKQPPPDGYSETETTGASEKWPPEIEHVVALVGRKRGVVAAAARRHTHTNGAKEGRGFYWGDVPGL